MRRLLPIGVLLFAATCLPLDAARGQSNRDIVRVPIEYVESKPAVAWSATMPEGTSLPINLPTALRLIDARAIDVGIASQRILQANAELLRAKYSWLPTVTLGPGYFRHDGQIQHVAGGVFTTTKSAFSAGMGVNMIFTPSDAIFAPLAARQVVRARQADLETATNNTLLAVAESYFSVQQARGELAGAEDAVRRAEELMRRAEKLAPGLVPPVEAVRARAELSRRKQAVQAAQERWRVASAELTRILRLEAGALVDPVEAPHLRVNLIDLDHRVDALIPVGLRNRPELASHQALVEAALRRLQQERVRPLVPSLALCSSSSPGGSTLGLFGGGYDALSNYGIRGDIDLTLVWEFQNLGVGNHARVKDRKAENQIAILELFRTQDRIAAEVAQALAQAKSAAERVRDAEEGLKDAADSVEKNFQGLSQTRRAGELIILMIRPQEVIAAIQALSQAYADYYGSIADNNRSQFRLYRALGYPAHLMGTVDAACMPTGHQR